MSPDYARRWAELLPNARMVCLPDAGHMLPYEQAAALAYAIDQGWDWGQAQWGKFYAANANLVPILISSTPNRKRK